MPPFGPFDPAVEESAELSHQLPFVYPRTKATAEATASAVVS